MNNSTASTTDNVIGISDEVHAAQPSNNNVTNVQPLNTAVVEPTAYFANELVDSSTEEEENDEDNTADVNRVQPIKPTEGTDDDDFRPAKKRKAQESDEIEVDEVRAII